MSMCQQNLMIGQLLRWGGVEMLSCSEVK